MPTTDAPATPRTLTEHEAAALDAITAYWSVVDVPANYLNPENEAQRRWNAVLSTVRSLLLDRGVVSHYEAHQIAPNSWHVIRISPANVRTTMLQNLSQARATAIAAAYDETEGQ